MFLLGTNNLTKFWAPHCICDTLLIGERANDLSNLVKLEGNFRIYVINTHRRPYHYNRQRPV
jgi:hypothetical protein